MNNIDTKKSSKKSSKNCKRGKIMRSGYTTKTGKKVASGCITAQSNSGKKTSLKLKKYVQKKESLQKQARAKFPKEASQKCPKGYIMREGYKTGSHKSQSKSGKKIIIKEHWTAPNCIPSQLGRSEKGKKLIVIMEKDVLGKYGYENIVSLTRSQRHTALKKAINKNY